MNVAECLCIKDEVSQKGRLDRAEGFHDTYPAPRIQVSKQQGSEPLGSLPIDPYERGRVREASLILNSLIKVKSQRECL